MKITNNILITIKYGWSSRRAWWFTASSRTAERFSRAALGSFWIGLSNLLSVAALSLVYGTVFKVANFKEYVIFLGLGLSIWNSIALSISSAPNLFKANAGNIQNTNTNPIFYTLSEWAFQIQTFIQSFGLVVICLALLKPVIILNLITVAILPIANIILFIYWFPLTLTILGAKYEDFFQLIPVALQVSFLLSPILYEKEALGQYQIIATVNPLYRILELARNSLIEGKVDILLITISTLVNITMVVLAIALLEKKRKSLPFYV